MGPAGIDMRGSEDRDILERDDERQSSKRDEEPAVLEREVEEIRENISGIVGELDRRRHELVDWRLQLRKHSVLIAAVGASCVLGFGLTVAVGAARRKRRNRPLSKARRFRDAVSRMIENPELVAQPQPRISKKALSAALTTLVAALVKMLARRMLEATESEPASILIERSPSTL